jgi:NitT/TauT family transport system substrate-binding protein
MYTSTASNNRRRSRSIGAAALALTAITALSACSAGAAADDSAEGSTTDVKLVLGWYANPESGGFFAAQDSGLYEEENLDVTIQQGGPTVSGTTIVASGKADIGIADAASIALARQEGIPIVAIAAMYQTNPVGVMVHADSGIESFEDMNDRTWVVQTGNTGADYMQREVGLNFTTQAYQGSIANFLADDSLVQQGWPTNEVFQAQQAGVETTFFSYAEAGFNPYNDVVFTSEAYLEENPEAVEAFLAASMDGWAGYIGDIDVATAANNALLQTNPEQTSESVWFAWDAQRSFLTDGDGVDQLGAMSLERWSTLVDQLTALDVLTEEVDPESLFDASLLPEVAAPDTLPEAPEGSF